MAQQGEKTGGGQGLDLKGLVLAAVAAVVAAVVTGEFFPKGALVTTAVTPVIITLVREGLRRPAEKVTATAARVTVAPVRGATALAGAGRRRTPDTSRFQEGRLRPREGDGEAAAGAPALGEGPVIAPPPPFDDTRAYDPRSSRLPDAPGEPPSEPDTAPAVAAGRPERKVYGRRRRFRLKLAIVTGLVAFGIAAVVLTASELAIGGSVTGGDRGTSLFGGERSGQRDDDSAGSSRGDPSEGGSDADDDGSAPSGSSGSGSAPESDGEVPAPESSEPAPSEEPAPAPAPAPAPSGSAPAE